MTIRELFQRRVVELIHGLPYDEVIDIEWKQSYEYNDPCVPRCVKPYLLPITIGRVMKSIKNKGIVINQVGVISTCEYDDDGQYYEQLCFWELTNTDGSECTDDDQTDETIEKLYNLIK